jgi:hypothetical protein
MKDKTNFDLADWQRHGTWWRVNNNNKRTTKRPLFSIKLKAFRGTIKDLKAANSNAHFETVTSKNEFGQKKYIYFSLAFCSPSL